MDRFVMLSDTFNNYEGGKRIKRRLVSGKRATLSVVFRFAASLGKKGDLVESMIRWFDDLPWVPLPGNPNVNKKELLSREEAGSLGLKLWRILFEKIEPSAAVLPHFHDTAEVIHFIHGEVHALVGGQRSLCRPGETLIVESGTVHGVANRGSAPSTQISYFIPKTDQADFGRTEQVPDVEI